MDSYSLLKKSFELQSNCVPSAMVTIIQTKGSTPREVGTKMLVSGKEFWGTIGGGKLEYLILEKTRQILESGSSQKLSFPLCSTAGQCCGGFVEVFIEKISPHPKIFIFGAGHVGQALIDTLSGTGFDFIVIDDRPEWLSQMPKTVTCIQDSGENFISEYPYWSSEFSYVLVLTYDHKLDEKLISELCTKKLKYLGLIGSQTKWQRFQHRLSGKPLSHVHCPMGLKIGGKSPKEVAISIAAELIQIKNIELNKVEHHELHP